MTETVDTLEGLEASTFAWERVWEPGQEVKTSYDILDYVRWQNNVVQGWLFTAADGLIKSKSRPRWRIGAVEERCCQDGVTFNAHAYIKDRWVVISDHEELDAVCKSDACKAIVPFGYVGKATYLVEHTWEAETAKRPPKVSTYRLSDKKQAGKTLEDDSKDYAIPPCRVLCHDKVLNEKLKVSSAGLLKIVQAKSRQKIKKITCIFLVDVPDASVDDGTPKIWLHHVRQLCLASGGAKLGGTAGGLGSTSSVRGGASVRTGTVSYANEMKSVTTDLTHQSSSFMRKTKCHGDFCTYCEEEEYHHMKMGDGESGGAVHREVKKAMGRHRKDGSVLKSTWKERMNGLVVEEDIEKEFAVDPRRAEAVGMSVDSSANDLDDEFDEETALPKPKKSEAHKVPNKTIDLARADMSEISDVGSVSKYAMWPEVLQHWFFRMGRSLVQKRVSKLQSRAGAVPISSGHSIGSAILTNPIPEVEAQDCGDDGEVSASTSVVRTSPISKRAHGGKDKSSAPQMTMDLAGNIIVDAGDQSVPFDLPGDHKVGGRVRRTVGQMATYYSETTVCGQCYHVYCELDKRRNSSQRDQLKERRKAIEAAENTEEAGRQIERRIFQQRKFVSRLAKTNTKKEGFMVAENGMAGGDSMSMYGSAYGSLADPSWAGAQMGFNESSMASSMASRFPMNGPAGPTKGRAPKGALPPLPWQLADKSKAKEYMETGGSFVKNIANKAQEMKEIVKQERMLVDLQYRRDIKAAEKRGEAKEEKFDWEAITGKAAQLRSEADERETYLQERLGRREAEAAKIRAVPKFDPLRLMHPHHRHLENLRNGMDPKEAELAANLPNAGYGNIKPNMQASADKRAQKMSALSKNAKRNRRALEPLHENSSEGAGSGMGMGVLQRTHSAGGGLGFSPPLGKQMAQEMGVVTSYENDSRVRNHAVSPTRSPQRAAAPVSTDPLASLNKYSALSGVHKQAAPTLSRAPVVADDGDYDDDEDDDEGIGWSPFMVNLNE